MRVTGTLNSVPQHKHELALPCRAFDRVVRVDLLAAGAQRHTQRGQQAPQPVHSALARPCPELWPCLRRAARHAHAGEAQLCDRAHVAGMQDKLARLLAAQLQVLLQQLCAREKTGPKLYFGNYRETVSENTAIL